MKKLIITIILFFIISIALPDWTITRGPNPGEIYFKDPTYTGGGIFYSNDFGQTVQCMDSTIYESMTINR